MLLAAGAGCGERESDTAGAGSSSTTSQAADGSHAPVTTSLPVDFAGGVDGPVMFAPGPLMDGGEDALIEGVLVRDDDCLFVGGGAPGSRLAVLWPFGTAWDEDAQQVVVANGTRIPLGSMLSAGGGYGSPEMLQHLLGDDSLGERVDACAEGEFKELAHVQHSISTTATGPPTGAPPVTSFPADQPDVDADYLTGDVALTLATITYLADVTVDDTGDALDLQGSYLVDVTVLGISWRAHDHWDLGVRVEPEFPTPGERIQLVINDEWRLKPQQRVTLGVTSRTRPQPSLSGYARFVLLDGAFANTDPTTGGFGSAIVAVVTDAHERGNEASLVDTLKAILAETNDWITRVNRIGPSEPLLGLLVDESSVDTDNVSDPP